MRASLSLWTLYPPHSGKRLDEPNHVDAGLQRVVPGDESDVPAADDEQPIGCLDEVPVDERLKRPRPVDARQRVPGKRERFLARSGRHEQDARSDQHVPVTTQDADDSVAEHGEGRRSQPHLDAVQRADFLLEERADVDSACPGEHGLRRAEEPMRLKNQFAPEPILVVDDQHVRPTSAEFDRRREPGRAAADDKDLDVTRLHVVQTPCHFPLRQDAEGRPPARLPSPDAPPSCMP